MDRPLDHLDSRLSYRRRQLNILQEVLAKDIDVSRSRLSAIETGSAKNPSIELLLRIVEALAMDPADFFGRVRGRP